MTILTNIAKWVDTFKFFLESDNCPPHDYPIVIWSSNNYPNKYILYNSEQLSSINKLNGFLSKINDSVIEIWDYSIENVKILAANGITAKHVPPISPNWYKDKLKSYGANDIYDVGLAGCISERRNHIIDALRSHGVSVNYMQIYGEERDKALASCKILVNIHCFDDFAIFESARCEPWLSIGKCVISENSLDNDPRCINVDYHMLVQTVLNTLKGYN
jgi:hypothetical protein